MTDSQQNSTAQTETLWGRIRRLIASGFGSSSQLGSFRLWIGVLSAVVGAMILLWLVDKIIFYYLARSYVDEVANASI